MNVYLISKELIQFKDTFRRILTSYFPFTLKELGLGV